MGEAKRRQSGKTCLVSYYDLMAREKRFARAAGDPELYLKRRAAGENIPVPCGGCVECCYYKRVEVYPDQEQPEHLTYLKTEIGDDGELQLQKRADGACVHLGDTGCTVYAHRPAACRVYDCRLWSLVSAIDGMDDGHCSPPWIFQPKTRWGRALLDAFQIAGMFVAAQFERENVTWTVHMLFERAALLVPDLARILQTLNEMSWEEKMKALGFLTEPRRPKPHQAGPPT